ncbi:WD domain, G-beta repeat protein, partial [Teladorsagia circumcincta]
MHCEFIDDKVLASTSNGFNGDGCEISVCELPPEPRGLNSVPLMFLEKEILQIWDLRTRKLLRELRGHEGSVPCVAGLTQQVTLKRLLMSVSMDRTIRIWNIEDGVCVWDEAIPTDADLLQ